MKRLRLLTFLGMSAVLCSCGYPKLVTHNVSYQSVRTRHAQPTIQTPIPPEVKIAVAYTISGDGRLTAIVYNRTQEIMTIDQTKSFFVDSDGRSTSYYDPTVHTTSTTDMSSATKGASVNLGSIAGALGIGGIVGQIADGINVGGSGTKGQAVTNATYVADQPKVSLAPLSNGAMSKVFKVKGLCDKDLDAAETTVSGLTEAQSYCRFSVCITYSVDGGNTYEKLITNFFTDSKVVRKVVEHGKVNDALRGIYQAKSDALSEPWYSLRFNYNEDIGISSFVRGVLYDYQ